ncbi:MAG: hypothetical protein ORN51_08515 [Akkermansiaceae bacterium]|nr:hypothetical protein [Akkermansiaceae bacterium]
MTRTLSLLLASAFTLLAASCCCTSDSKPPRLHRLPRFHEIKEAPAQEAQETEVRVTPTK